MPNNQQCIEDLIQLAATEGRPLAMPPAEILALEDKNYVVDPFTGTFYREAPRHVTPLGVLCAIGLVNDQAQPTQEQTI